jgi:hypothetical protein
VNIFNIFGGRKADKGENPGEEFSLLELTGENKLFIALINMAYKGYRYKAKYPWSLSISIPLINPGENGIPNPNDSIALDEFEDKLNERLIDTCAFQYVGRITGEGSRKLMYYLNTPQETVNLLNKILESNESRAFEYCCEKDAGWEFVNIYLK